MRMMVVSSPHAYTTRDVWNRVCTGLDKNGIDTVGFDLLPRYNIMEFLTKAAKQRKYELPQAWSINNLACEPVFGAARFHNVTHLMVVSPQYFPMGIIEMLRDEGVVTMGYFTECPYEDTMVSPIQAMYFDHVFVNDRNSVELFKTFCDSVHYLPHSFDPTMHYPPEKEERDEKVIFIGTGYVQRKDFLRQVDWTNVDLEIYGLWLTQGRDRLKPYIKGDVLENNKTAQMYRDNAIGISIHREMRYVNATLAIDEGEAYSVGPRTYELAACGMFQISDFRAELFDLFGDAVPVYETPADLGRIVRRALDDSGWRNDLAARQQEAVQGHTCEERMKTVLDAVA